MTTQSVLCSIKTNFAYMGNFRRSFCSYKNSIFYVRGCFNHFFLSLLKNLYEQKFKSREDACIKFRVTYSGSPFILNFSAHMPLCPKHVFEWLFGAAEIPHQSCSKNHPCRCLKGLDSLGDSWENSYKPAEILTAPLSCWFSKRALVFPLKLFHIYACAYKKSKANIPILSSCHPTLS